MTTGPIATARFSHSQRARPIGILFLIAGVIGLVAAWCLAYSWATQIVLTVFFGLFAVGGGSLAIYGGEYRTWIVDGQVHWNYPTRIQGSSGSCSVADVVELQHVIINNGGTGGREFYRLVLCDGTTKALSFECIGDVRNAEVLYRAMRKTNPSILFNDITE